MKRLKRILLARATLICLLLCFAGLMLLANILPQRALFSSLALQEWHADHPFLGVLANNLALDHIYTSFWFFGLLLISFFSLVLSTMEQTKNAWRKTFRFPLVRNDSEKLIHCHPIRINQVLEKHFYIPVGKDGDIRRFVKYPWGYWGNVLLHIGVVLVMVASLFIFLTQKRGRINMVEGEVYPVSANWLSQEKGMLAGPFSLPAPVRVEKILPEFWETDDLKQLRTVVNFFEPANKTIVQELHVNETGIYQGVRIDQTREFGTAFLVTLIDKNKEQKTIRLDLAQPLRRGLASHGTFSFDGVPFLIKAKYFADAGRKSRVSDNPLLILRLIDDGLVAGELPLTRGASGQFGPYIATLTATNKWACFIFSDIKGIPLIFLGFFVIIFGGGLLYFMPPRSVLVQRKKTGVVLIWKSGRFADFYENEIENIIQEATAGKT
jgi:hypothetical protein